MRLIHNFAELCCKLIDRAPVASLFAAWTLLRLPVAMQSGLDGFLASNVIFIADATLGIAAAYDVFKALLGEYEAVLHLATLLFQWSCAVLVGCCLLFGVHQPRTLLLLVGRGSHVLVCALSLLLISLVPARGSARPVTVGAWGIGLASSVLTLASAGGSGEPTLATGLCDALFALSFLTGTIPLLRVNAFKDTRCAAARWNAALTDLQSS